MDDISSIRVHIKVKCISWCHSIFLPTFLKKDNGNSNCLQGSEEMNELNQISRSKRESDMNKLIGNIFIGTVKRTEGELDFPECIEGKDVIGIYTMNSRIFDDMIIANYNEIIEYPENDLNYLAICATFRPLYESHICISNINFTKKTKFLIIFADSLLQVLPFLKLLMKKKFHVIMFLAECNLDKKKISAYMSMYNVNKEYMKDKIVVQVANMDISKYIFNITNEMGVSIIIVFPNLKLDKDLLKRTILNISSLHANLIYTYELDFMTPDERKVLFEKGIKIHFHNIDNYIYHDHDKRVNAFNYVLLSLLNSDIHTPSVSIRTYYFSKIEEILSMECTSAYSMDSCIIHVNKNML